MPNVDELFGSECVIFKYAVQAAVVVAVLALLCYAGVLCVKVYFPEKFRGPLTTHSGKLIRQQKMDEPGRQNIHAAGVQKSRFLSQRSSAVPRAGHNFGPMKPPERMTPRYYTPKPKSDEDLIRGGQN